MSVLHGVLEVCRYAQPLHVVELYDSGDEDSDLGPFDIVDESHGGLEQCDSNNG